MIGEHIVATTGERLKRAMEYRHTTAAEISKATGISRGSLSQYISGKFSPKQDRIYILANHLRVSPAWLMGLDVDMENKENENIVAKANTDSIIDTEWPHSADEEMAMMQALARDKSPSSQQFLAHAIGMYKALVQKNTISAEDRKMLHEFHALAPDSQVLVMSMIEKLLLTQESLAKGESHEKKEVTA